VTLLKVLITGAKGMLGTDMCEVLGGDYEIIAYDIDDFDIVDMDATIKVISNISPPVIVHLAAFTDVEACEDERLTAFRCNALGAMNVAKAARVVGAHLVYLSTDYVFDGTKREPYLEVDRPNPINFYGLTKLYGEQYVSSLCPSHLIIRTSWLFGPNGRNFVDTIVNKASQGGPLRIVNDQRGCPTYSMDLARSIREAIEKRLEGIIHLTNSSETTWFELASHALGLAGVDTKIEPVASAHYKTKARRPQYSGLGSLVREMSGMEALPDWQDAVRRHLLRKGMIRGSGSS
jgi:dTDP-4-dehydrorhamnose reductase